MPVWTLLLAFVLLLSGCASTPRTQDIPVKNAKNTIYVIYRGLHTSIMVDAKPFAAQSALLGDKARGQRYIRMGFGDGDYFTGKVKNVGSATKALFASNYSAIQLLPYDYAPFDEIPVETIYPLAVDDAGLQRLIAFFDQSIALKPAGLPDTLTAENHATGLFYRGKAHYSFLSNCNTWTSQGLQAAGLPMPKRYTASGVFEQVRAISSVQAQAGLFATAKAR